MQQVDKLVEQVGKLVSQATNLPAYLRSPPVRQVQRRQPL